MPVSQAPTKILPALNVKGRRKPAPPSLAPKKELLPIWTSAGVADKPEVCKLCPFRFKGSGFVPDWYPNADGDIKLGFLLPTPLSDDVIEGRPWAGRAGYAWEKKYLAPFGLSLSDVFVGHVIRCQPKDRRFGKPQYPTGKLRRDAELTCRQHDERSYGGPVLRHEGLKSWNPNLFVVTFNPSETVVVPALSVLLLKDIEKAVKKSREGHRVLVLMGTEAKDLVAPWLTGAVKTWRGTYWRGDWPYKEGSMLREPGFIAA